MKILNQDEVRARFMPGVRLVFRFPRPRGVMSLLNFQRRSLQSGQIQTSIMARRTDRRLKPTVDVAEPGFTQSAKRA